MNYQCINAAINATMRYMTNSLNPLSAVILFEIMMSLICV